MSSSNRRFATGLARAAAGALIFSLPMLMTMEMWQLGFYMSRPRLILLLAVLVPLLIGLSIYGGFERTRSIGEDVRDSFIAIAVGCVTAAAILTIFGIVEPGMPLDEVAGKVALQAVPGSIGAMLARSQLGQQTEEPREGARPPMLLRELLLMAIGALFLSFNVAPTEEMVLIAYRMTLWHGLALCLLSLLTMHAFVYAVEFRGSEPSVHPSGAAWTTLIRFTMPGYGLVLLISLYMLWTFGRTDGADLQQVMMAATVLGFPGAVGAAAARLIM